MRLRPTQDFTVEIPSHRRFARQCAVHSVSGSLRGLGPKAESNLARQHFQIENPHLAAIGQADGAIHIGLIKSRKRRRTETR